MNLVTYYCFAMKKKYLLLFFGLLGVYSCSLFAEKDGDYDPTFCECYAFVFGYWSSLEDTMYAKIQEHGLISVGCGNHKKYKFGAYSGRLGGGYEDAAGYKHYLEKCDRYSDVGYDTAYYVRGTTGPSNGYHYFAEEIRSVGISYSQDWAEGYPAGSELGELFTLYAISPLEYIRRGYTDRISCKGHPDEEIFAVIQEWNGCDIYVGFRGSDGKIHLSTEVTEVFDNFYGEPVVRKVSELTEDDLRLVGGGECDYVGGCILFVLRPDFLPEDLSGVLTITVTTDRRTYTVPFTGLADLQLPE